MFYIQSVINEDHGRRNKTNESVRLKIGIEEDETL